MDSELQAAVACECHRLETELRLTSQKHLVPEVLDEIRSVRFHIWTDAPSVSAIIGPFKKLIENPKSTDVITTACANSLEIFLVLGLFQTMEDLSALIQCLCSCQCQITSESAPIQVHFSQVVDQILSITMITRYDASKYK